METQAYRDAKATLARHRGDWKLRAASEMLTIYRNTRDACSARGDTKKAARWSGAVLGLQRAVRDEYGDAYEKAWQKIDA